MKDNNFEVHYKGHIYMVSQVTWRMLVALKKMGENIHDECIAKLLNLPNEKFMAILWNYNLIKKKWME